MNYICFFGWCNSCVIWLLHFRGPLIFHAAHILWRWQFKFSLRFQVKETVRFFALSRGRPCRGSNCTILKTFSFSASYDCGTAFQIVIFHLETIDFRLEIHWFCGGWSYGLVAFSDLWKSILVWRLLLLSCEGTFLVQTQDLFLKFLAEAPLFNQFGLDSFWH